MVKFLQTFVEKRSYNILFDLENELRISLKKLPEIYYVGKDFSFENIGIDLEKIGLSLDKKTAFFLYGPKIILTNTLSKKVLGEEMGHFIHYEFIELPQNKLADFSLKTISEMIGFFCSKLIDSKRKSGFKEDNFKNKSFPSGIIKHIKYIEKKGALDDLVHQQGYLLGERLFNKYLSKQISKKDIRKIIKNPLSGEYTSFYEFFKLRERLLN